jgi:hypothetical protein
MSKPGSRWLKGAQRLSQKATVEHSRQVRSKRGAFRTQVDAPTEVAYAARFAEGPGWRHGAKIRPRITNRGTTNARS